MNCYKCGWAFTLGKKGAACKIEGCRKQRLDYKGKPHKPKSVRVIEVEVKRALAR